MAQYFQLSNDKSSTNQLYNSEDAQAVQYIIADEPASQFPQQQVLIASERLMVVERPQVVIDQGQVAFQQGQVQAASYAIQNNGVSASPQPGQQPVFYMEGGAAAAPPTVEQGQSPTAQPIVLNHQLGTSNTIIRTKVNASQLQQHVRQQVRPQGMQQQMKTPVQRPGPGQPRNVMTPPQVRIGAPQMQTPVRANMPAMVNKQTPGPAAQQQQQPQQQHSPNMAMFKQQATVQQGQQPPKPISKMLQEFQQQQKDPMKEEEETVMLPDGTSVPVSVYTKMRTQAIRQRLGGQPSPSPATPPATPPSQPPVHAPTSPPVLAKAGGPRQGARPRPAPQPRVVRPGAARPAGPRPAARPPPPLPGFGVPPPPLPQQKAGPPPQQQRFGGAGAVPPGKPPYQQQQQAQLMSHQQQQQQRLPPTSQQQQQHPRQQQQQPQQHAQGQQQMQQPPQQQQLLSSPQNSYVITPPQPNRPQRPLPSCIASSQIQRIIENTPISEEFANSIRMLVLLENGEQRLITFTLPKEACTIHEILEQVNVPFTADTNIQVTEANTSGINYIVTVGNIQHFVKEEESTETDDSQSASLNQSRVTVSSGDSPVSSGTPPGPGTAPAASDPPKAPSPEPAKETPRIVPGKLAVCNNCGILSEDFNRCMRCKKKFPDNVKAVPAPHSNGDVKITLAASQNPGIGPNKSTPPAAVIKVGPQQSPIAASTPKGTPAAVKKKPSKPNKIVEHESVVISSDEEEDEKSTKKIVDEHILKSLGASITISPITKEPSLMELKKFTRRVNSADVDTGKQYNLSIKCRTVRIGSYRYNPPENVFIDSKGVTILAPMIENKTEIKTIKIDQKDIVKVLVSFGKALPVVFYYLNPAIAPTIRTLLGMKSDSDTYFDPISEKEDSFRRITLLPEEFSDDFKIPFQQIYNVGALCIMEELSTREANEILIKICPKEASKPLGSASFTEIKQILVYPPEGRGRIAINTEDYICLAQDQFLNDVIIDFYLKYIVDNLPEDKKERVHVFSTFFYKRLTTKPTKALRKTQPTEWDPNLNAAQKRHARVKNWTKNVNLFEKDFVIVPINENAHWFLAIICFPGMEGPHTFDGLPYKLEANPRKPKKKAAAPAGNVSVTPVKKEKPIVCEEPEGSDRDEAEGDESDLESDDSEETATPQNSQPVATVAPPPAAATVSPRSKEPKPPIKQPCILIFDSLAGTSRNRVVATLRDYLTWEYHAKMNEEKVYNKDVIKGASPKVPQQTNFTDCGLYVLQYVEQFFASPVEDYRIPISTIKNWFEEITVTKKREDIANLIKDLMRQDGKDVSVLPDISFPTLNGKIVEVMEKSDVAEEEESDMFTDIEDSQLMEQEEAMDSIAEEEKSEGAQSPLKPSVDSVTDFMTHNVNPNLLKPTTTNRDTLSYLKAKRIIRHKNVDGPEVKKIKTDGSDSN